MEKYFNKKILEEDWVYEKDIYFQEIKKEIGGDSAIRKINAKVIHEINKGGGEWHGKSKIRFRERKNKTSII